MILVCGEALVDLVRGTARPGGSPTNVAVGLARLGVPAALLARLGTDEYAALLRTHLRDAGVDLRWAVPAPEPTTVAVAEVGADGAARYAFTVEGRTDGAWSVADLPASLPPDTVAVQVSGSLALAFPALGAVVEELMRRARAAGATVVLDPNVRPTLLPDHAAAVALVERWVGLADLVKVSDEDVAWLYPGADRQKLAEHWQALGARAVVVTLGPAGAFARFRRTGFVRPAEPVEVVDTVGAGDAFTAGLLWRLYAGRLLGAGFAELRATDLSQAVKVALHVAAVTCGRPGADPPRPADL